MKYSFKRLFIPGIIFSTALLAGCGTGKQVTYTRPDFQMPDSFATTIRPVASEQLTRAYLFTDTLLVTLIDRAVRQNTDLLVALHRIDAMKAQLLSRQGQLAPTVGAEVGASAQRYGDYTMEGVGNFDTNLSGNIKSNQKAPVPITPNYFVGLRSSWEVDIWGKLKKQERSAYMTLLASEEGRRFAVTSVVAEIAERYYTLLSLDAKLDIIRSNILLQDSVVSISRIQKEAGRTTELGVQQFAAQALRTRTMAVEIENEQARIENEIRFLAGDFPGTIPRAGVFADIHSQVVLPALPAALVLQRPDVKEAELLLQAKGYDVAAAKAELMPSLQLNSFLGLNAFSGAMLFNPGSVAYGVIGGLTAPLVNRRAIKGAIGRTEAEQQQALQNYRKTVLQAFGETQTWLRTLEQMQKMYALNQQETKVLSGAINISNELYKAGYASYLEVMTAQKTALEAELNLVDTKKRMFGSLVALYRASGGGW